MHRTLLFMLLLSSASLPAQSRFMGVSLPDAEYPKLHPQPGIDWWFTIILRHDSTIFSFDGKEYWVPSPENTKLLFCELNKVLWDVQKKEGLNPILLQPKIVADEQTPYHQIDQTVECFKQMLHAPKVHFATRYDEGETGFKLIFPEINASTRPFLEQLYGSWHVNTPYHLGDCLPAEPVEDISANPPDDMPPPPPPPPPPPVLPDSLRFINRLPQIVQEMGKGKKARTLVLEWHSDSLFINRQPASFDELTGYIQDPKNPYSLYIMPHRDNSYADFIRLIDFLYMKRAVYNDKTALRLTGKKYDDLSGWERVDLSKHFSFRWSVISLAEQLEMDALRN